MVPGSGSGSGSGSGLAVSPQRVCTPIDEGASYLVRASVTSGEMSCFVRGVQIMAPRGVDSCAAHLKNRGVTVEGDSARIEFGAIGSVDSFECQHITVGAPRVPCTYVLRCCLISIDVIIIN